MARNQSMKKFATVFNCNIWILVCKCISSLRWAIATPIKFRSDTVEYRRCRYSQIMTESLNDVHFGWNNSNLKKNTSKFLHENILIGVLCSMNTEYSSMIRHILINLASCWWSFVLSKHCLRIIFVYHEWLRRIVYEWKKTALFSKMRKNDWIVRPWIWKLWIFFSIIS